MTFMVPIWISFQLILPIKSLPLVCTRHKWSRCRLPKKFTYRNVNFFGQIDRDTWYYVRKEPTKYDRLPKNYWKERRVDDPIRWPSFYYPKDVFNWRLGSWRQQQTLWVSSIFNALETFQAWTAISALMNQLGFFQNVVTPLKGFGYIVGLATWGLRLSNITLNEFGASMENCLLDNFHIKMWCVIWTYNSKIVGDELMEAVGQTQFYLVLSVKHCNFLFFFKGWAVLKVHWVLF